MAEQERISPLLITDNDTNEKYELDFSREAVRFAERNGFKIREVIDFPSTLVADLFYYAFRKNHKKLARNQVDAIREEKLGGLHPKVIERLIQLYNQAALVGTIRDEDEDLAKNSKVTIEF